MKDKIIPFLEQLLIMFKAPQLLMKKRQSKLLDYDRVSEMKVNGEPVCFIYNRLINRC